MNETTTIMIHRLLAYALAASLVSASTAAWGAPGRGAIKASSGKTAVSVFDCRLPAETGYAVPHERLLWMPSADGFDDQKIPRYRPHGERPGVVELVFDGKLDTTIKLNCDGQASELILDVETRGRTALVTLASGDVHWRVDLSARALVVWSPRSIATAISQAWPGQGAREILRQARQLGMAPEHADELERRLEATKQRADGLEALTEGRNQDAAQALSAAFEVVPNDVEAGLALARARYRLGQYDGAEELLESLAHMAPRSAEIRHEQGLLALSLDQRADAHEHFQQAAEAGWPNANFYLGFLAFEAEDDVSAGKALDRFLVQGGDGPLAGRARTMLEVMAGREALRSKAPAVAEAPTPRPRSPRPRSPRPRPPPVDEHAVRLYSRPLVLKGFARRDLALRTLEGRPVVLHLWATWCPPCRREIPSLMRFVANDLPALAERGMALLTVSMDYTEDELAAAAATWAAEHEGTLPAIFWDPSWRVAEGLGLGSALPQTVLIRPDGTVETALIGAQDWQDERLLERLARWVDSSRDRSDE